MISFQISKKRAKELARYGLFVSFILLFALLAFQGVVHANPAAGNGTSTSTPPPPPPTSASPPEVSPDRDEAKCKMLVYPKTITLGEPFEVCWLGHKFSDVALGPDRALTPSETDPYLKELSDGKTLYCHSFQVPSASNSTLDSGVYDFRCTGPGGTIFATTVNVIDPLDP